MKRNQGRYVINKITMFVEVLKQNILFTFFYILGIIISGLAPTIQILVIKNIIDLLQKAIDSGIEVSIIQKGVFLILVESIVFLIMSISTDIELLFSDLMSLRVNDTIRENVIKKLKKVSLSSFDDVNFYNTYENMLNETSNAIQTLITGITLTISLTISLVGYVVIISEFSVVAVIILMCSIIPALIIRYKFENEKHLFKLNEIATSRKTDYYFTVMTQPKNFKEIKIYRAFQFFNKKRREEYKKYYSKRKRLLSRELIGTSIVSVISKVGLSVVLIWLFYSIANGTTSISIFTSIFLAATSLDNTFESILSAFSLLYENMKSLDFYFEFIEHEELVEDGYKSIVLSEIEIEFRNVGFTYPHSNKKVLDNVNFTIEKTGLTLILGDNGSGKSTIMKLILRLYDVTTGEILINNKNITEYSLEDLYSQITCVFQDYGQYYTSIRENIEFGCECGEQKLLKAMEESTSKEFIQKLEKGLETQVGKTFDEEGIELSTGQYQKLAIARALLRETKIIMLDESTSSIDTVSEAEMFGIINKFKHDRAIICVTHKLYLAPLADRIIFIQNGSIQAIGKHEDILSSNADYKRFSNTI